MLKIEIRQIKKLDTANIKIEQKTISARNYSKGNDLYNSEDREDQQNQKNIEQSGTEISSLCAKNDKIFYSDAKVHIFFRSPKGMCRFNILRTQKKKNSLMLRLHKGVRRKITYRRRI